MQTENTHQLKCHYCGKTKNIDDFFCAEEGEQFYKDGWRHSQNKTSCPKCSNKNQLK